MLKSLIDKQKQTHGKLYCCFVEFKKAFDTVPRGLLWQVLETLGIRGPILDCINSLYSHDSAAVRNQEGISDIFDCLMGVKQGCPLSATLFGLFVDGLEQPLMDTLGHDAPVAFFLCENAFGPLQDAYECIQLRTRHTAVKC